MLVAVRQRDGSEAAVLETLHKVSDPLSTSYGRHLSLAQLDALSSNREGAEAVAAWLALRGFAGVAPTANFHYVRATATPAIIAESLGEECLPTCVPPAALAAHARTVATWAAARHGGDESRRSMRDKRQGERRGQRILGGGGGGGIYPGGNTTLSLLNRRYAIASNRVRNLGATQAVFAIGDNFDPRDIAQYRADLGLPSDLPPITTAGANNFPFECPADPNLCLESSLDLEVISSIAQGGNTTFWKEDANEQGFFYEWLVHVAAEPNPPLVLSLSYDLLESDPRYRDGWDVQFNLEAAKLGVRGVSLVVASGDDGVAGYPARSNAELCGFHPSFPSSSPYVTSVGGTMGPEHLDPGASTEEVACTSDGGGLITSGGGFSNKWPTPSYQATAVAGFLRSGAGALPPASLFNASGRAYPDVALLAHNYPTLVGGKYYQVSGTSASTPAFAALLTLLNDALLGAGRPPVGFVNPAIYHIALSAPTAFHDVTNGTNNCCAAIADPICCEHGFDAQAGWDPVAGLGSVDFGKLKAAFLSLANTHTHT